MNAMRAVFLDLETTGLDPKIHVVIDAAFKIVDINSGRILDQYQAVIKQDDASWKRHDPVSLQINGYTWELIQTGKDPAVVTQEIIEIFKHHEIVRGNSIFICQNPAFDRIFLSQLVPIHEQEKLLWPYHWLDLASMYWALTVKRHVEEQRSLPETMTLSKNEIAKCYHLPPEEHPHLAINGVDHLMDCYQAVLGVKFHSTAD
jgi:DNA polymerase-3 subunit epsilon/oligoribonuclease